MRPSDATWSHRSGSTLAQVMACYLTAQSHCLNQWSHIKGFFIDIHLRAISQVVPKNLICCMCSERILLRLLPHLPVATELTHRGRAMHICVSKLTIIASDNSLSPGRRQAIIWNNVGILSIGLFGIKFSEISIEILTFSLKKMRLKVSSAKCRSFCLGLNVLTLQVPWDILQDFVRHFFSRFWEQWKHIQNSQQFSQYCIYAKCL